MSTTLKKLWPSINGHTITKGAAPPESQVMPEESGVSHKKVASAEQVSPVSPKPSGTIHVDEPNVWIINDGLLRDEGVLFGLSGASYEEKIDAISNYYDEQKAPCVQAKLLLDEKIKATQSELARVRDELASKQGDIDRKVSPVRGVSESNYLRYSVGLLLAVVGSVGCFYLVYYFVAPGYGIPAACGIFLFGLFTQMAPISSWMQDDAARPGQDGLGTAKQYLLEFGPSVVSAILVSYLISTGTGSLARASVFGLFLLFLFFYNGKLILALSQVLSREVKVYKEFRFARKDHVRVMDELRLALSALQIQVDSKLKELAAAEDGVKAELTKIEEMNEVKHNKVNLFVSEYKLARHFITNIKQKDSE